MVLAGWTCAQPPTGGGEFRHGVFWIFRHAIPGSVPGNLSEGGWSFRRMDRAVRLATPHRPCFYQGDYMPETSARVELIAYTPEPLSVVYTAFRQCYLDGKAEDMWNDIRAGMISRDEQGSFVRRTIASGHASPIEHVAFTFAISGVSRSLTHQLVRHRIASYSQQSQRYVDACWFGYVIPPAVRSSLAARSRFERFMREASYAYADIKTILEAEGHASAKEDARFVLPQSAASNVVVTMNCRSLMNFFEHRCCSRAQWEIRGVANSMLGLCRDVLPELFDSAGPRCESLGYCPEGERFSCGRYPCHDRP